MSNRTILLIVATVVGVLAYERIARAPRSTSPAAAAPALPAPTRSTTSTLAARTSGPAVPPVQLEEVQEARDAIVVAGTRVYLDQMFGETDSLIRRWDPDKVAELRVAYVIDDVAGWTPAHRSIVRDAFTEWEGVGPRVVFTEVFDTVGADIVIRWVEKFNIDRAGQADLTWDSRGRIKHSEMKLAILTPTGRVITSEKLRAIALHEIGHSLGLPHSDDPADLMYPTTDHPRLTSRDTTTFALLYRLPSISLKWTADNSPSPR